MMACDVSPVAMFTIIMLFDLKSSKQDFVYARTGESVQETVIYMFRSCESAADVKMT